MNRITADRALFQCFKGVFVLDLMSETHTPSGECSAHWGTSQQEIGDFGVDAGSHFGTRCILKRLRIAEGEGDSPAGMYFLVLAEKLLGVLNEADDYNYRRTGHAHEEHDFEDVHREQPNLEHDINCSFDLLPDSIFGLRAAEDWRPARKIKRHKLLQLFEIRTVKILAGITNPGRQIAMEVYGALLDSARCGAFHGGWLAAGALTALLLDLPFPLAGPLPAWRTVFAWFALVPLLVALLRLPEAATRKPLRWAFFTGWLTGALWFGANCYWVYDTMHLYGGLNEPLAVLSLVLFSIYLGFWFGVFALALVVVRRATVGGKYAWVALAAIPFFWTAMEFALARIPAFPWDLLGYSQIDNGLLTRLAPWTGVYGISFVLAVGNALLAAGRLYTPPKSETWNRRAFIHPTEYGLLLWIAMNFMVSTRLVPSPKPSATETAVLVQPNLNVDSDDVWVGPEWDRHISQFQQLGAESCKSFLRGFRRRVLER